MSLKNARLSVLFVMSLLAAAQVAAMDLKQTEKQLTTGYVHGDTAFLVGQGRRLRSIVPLVMELDPSLIANRGKFPFNLEYGLWSLRDKPVTLSSASLPPALDMSLDHAQVNVLQQGGKVAMQRYQQEGNLVLAIMKKALTCRPGKRPPDFGAPAYEYVASHQLMAVIIASHRGCLPSGDVSKRVIPYASRVYTELMATVADPLSDLYLERVAMLNMAGFGGAILPDVYERIARAQSPDGLWRFNDALTPALLPYEHSSALAYFVMSSHLASR